VTTELLDGEQRELDPRYVDLQRHVGWITVGVLAALSAAGFLVLFLVADARRTGLLVAVASVAVALSGLAWFLQRWPAIDYRHASYRVSQAGLEIRNGVYWRAVINVPRSRVQHTDVSQGPVERRYGLATLTIHTAGTEDASVALSGLPHETALAIRDHLLPRELPDAV
jgi:membrane protein YdbS with pleckstrin-like domain